MNLPQEFLDRMERLLGDEFEIFLNTYQEPRKYGLRVNTGKISVEAFRELAPFHLSEIPWISNGFYYEREDDPARHPFYYAGLYYLQEPSAMTPAQILPVSPGERVLDLCAAPGGKATALGAKLRGEGLLVANDISASRAKALLKNLEVFGITNAFVTTALPAKLEQEFGESFDKILVDAPCSGEGMFRKDLANARAWSMKKVEECAAIQHDITRQAVRMLRPGGLMLYSTCTFSPEENEQTIASLLQDCPELELQEIPWYEGYTPGIPSLADGNEELKKCVRIFPHKMEGEGHFLALLKKQGVLPGNAGWTGYDAGIRSEAGKPGEVKEKQKKMAGKQSGEKYPDKKQSGKNQSGKNQETLEEFLRDLSETYATGKIELRGDHVYWNPPIREMGVRIPFLRNGLYFGELRKGRFEPSQSLAMALRKEEYASVLDFDQADSRVKRYLRGETVDVEDMTTARTRGWQLVCASGYPLGWGRLVNGTLKNKYHPGWRMV